MGPAEEKPAADPEHPRRGTGLAGSLALTLLALLSGFGTARLLDREPVWVRDVEHRKLSWLAERREEPDTLVLGSSLVYRHVDPQAIDEALRASGIPSTTFNLGLPGLSLAELWWLLDQIEAIDPPRVERVLLSPPKARTDLEHNWGSVRSVQWHEPGPTWWALRLVADEPLPLAEKLELAALHLADLARNRAGIGIGWAELRDDLAGTAEVREMGRLGNARLRELLVGPHGDGFRSFGSDWPTAVMDQQERNFLAKRSNDWRRTGRNEWLRELARRLEERPPDVRPTPAMEAFLERFVARLRARGWEVVLFTQPLIVPDEPLAQYAHLWRPPAGRPPVIDFSDPRATPELFTPGIHFDREHLNHRGARRLSELLAARLVEILRERPR